MKKLFALVLISVTFIMLSINAFAYTETPLYGRVEYIYSANGLPVNVRQGPGKGYEFAPIRSFAVGTKVYLQAYATGTDGDLWYRVEDSGGNQGWVNGNYLRSTIDIPTNTHPLSASQAFGSSLLKVGSKGYTVKNLQKCLAAANLLSSVDGVFGSKTEAAVKAYQSDNELDDDGLVGDNTKRVLWNEFENLLKTEGFMN